MLAIPAGAVLRDKLKTVTSKPMNTASVPDSDLVPSLDVLPFHERPCAAPGLVSYRYPTGSGSWIMIGAVDHDEALRQAARSLEVGTVTISKLEVWSGMGSGYVLASPGVTLPASPVDSVGVQVSAQPYLTPDKDSDPLGVYRFSFADDLQRRFDEVDNSDDEDGSGFDALHAENNTRLAEILTAVNSHAANLAKMHALEKANTALWNALNLMVYAHENADETGYVTDVGFMDMNKLCESARAALALPSA